MGSSSVKLIAALVIWVLNLCSSACPLFFSSGGWMSGADALAGGIFMGSSIVHLLPESVHAFDGISQLPVSAILSLTCFTFLVAVELFAGSHTESSGSARPDVPISGVRSGQISTVTLLLYFVLIFHGFVEAVAFAVMTSVPMVLALFFAIIGHKPVETFALGLELLRSKPSRAKYCGMMVVFSSIAPLTIVVTMEIQKNASPLFFGLVTSLSAGAFLFIGCRELAELLHRAHHWSAAQKFTHLKYFVAGIVWMAVFGFFGGGHQH
jgi:zinc transporter 1/2/3